MARTYDDPPRDDPNKQPPKDQAKSTLAPGTQRMLKERADREDKAFKAF